MLQHLQAWEKTEQPSQGAPASRHASLWLVFQGLVWCQWPASSWTIGPFPAATHGSAYESNGRHAGWAIALQVDPSAVHLALPVSLGSGR